MHKYKQYTRLFVFSIIAFIFLFPIIYLIVFSVFHSDTGFSLMNYYKVFLANPDYLIKFWRSLAMCLMIAAGQTLFSCMSGTAFAKYSFPLKKFWFILFALFMILPIQVTLLPNYILLEKLKLLNSWKALIIPAIFSFNSEQLEALRHHFPNISKAMEEGKDLLKQITRSRGFGMGM